VISEVLRIQPKAIEALPVRSFVIDGEAIVCDDNGLAAFDLIHGYSTSALSCAPLICQK
jgi:ATP-dependent DNA ligase